MRQLARSAETLNYADQRYYASTYGRFNTADQYQASAGPKDPGTWNRYAYVSGDPVNSNDPRGLQRKMDCTVNYSDEGNGGDDCANIFGDDSYDCDPLCNLGSSGKMTPRMEWDALSPTCQQALQTAVPKTSIGGMVAALNRATAAESTLIDAAGGTSSPTFARPRQFAPGQSRKH